MNNHIVYDRELNVISVDGKNLIDLSSVRDGSRALLHSRRGSEDDIAFESVFNFNDNELFPFGLGELSLTPSSFIRAVVENELMVGGLECSGEIAMVYRMIRSKNALSS